MLTFLFFTINTHQELNCTGHGKLLGNEACAKYTCTFVSKSEQLINVVNYNFI